VVEKRRAGGTVDVEVDEFPYLPGERAFQIVAEDLGDLPALDL